MNRRYTIDIFVEDRGHEFFIRPLTERICREENKGAYIRIRSAVGGHGRVMNELKNYMTLIQKGIHVPPDLLIVAVDTNCSRLAAKKAEIQKGLIPPLIQTFVPACPDPHVERWYMADRTAFERIVGKSPSMKRKKCERDYYKKILAKAVRDAGHPSTLGGLEFGSELAKAIDLYRAGKQENSLKLFIEELRGALKR